MVTFTPNKLIIEISTANAHDYARELNLALLSLVGQVGQIEAPDGVFQITEFLKELFPLEHGTCVEGSAQ